MGTGAAAPYDRGQAGMPVIHNTMRLGAGTFGEAGYGFGFRVVDVEDR